VRTVTNRNEVTTLSRVVDSGEAEEIVLAEEIRTAALLIDEKQGRELAEARGIQCLGLVGVLLMAKQNRVIPSVTDVLNALETNANFYLDKGLKQSVLRRVGE
jgi:uncharacterized protein